MGAALSFQGLALEEGGTMLIAGLLIIAGIIGLNIVVPESKRVIEVGQYSCSTHAESGQHGCGEIIYTDDGMVKAASERSPNGTSIDNK
jgi:hypothetical protein